MYENLTQGLNSDISLILNRVSWVRQHDSGGDRLTPEDPVKDPVILKDLNLKDLNLKDLLSKAPVLPVITLHHLEQAVPLAEALVRGGLTNLEITLRTPVALKVIQRIAEEVPEAVVGAGTVTHPRDLEAVSKAGGRFAVSPGATPALLAEAAQGDLPLIPGIMTPSEAMTAHDAGFEVLKLFPAEPAGGRALLKAIGGPLPALSFCPTGGIGPATFRDYLKLDNVICVGGSWVAPEEAVLAGDWSRITDLATATHE